MKNILLLFILFWAYNTHAQNNIQYEYDAAQRVSKATYSNGVIVQYSYDELGNRTSKVVSNPNYSGLVGHYTFTGNANDNSPSLNNGTVLNGAALSASVKGDVNGSYCLDGVDDYINTPIQQNNITQYSISAWVKTTLVQATNGKMFTIVQTRGTAGLGGKSITLGYLSDVGKWFIALDSDGVIIGKQIAKANTNEWMHIAGTWSGTAGSAITPSQFNLYINGQLQTAEDLGSASGGPSAPISGIGTTKIGYQEAWNSYVQGCIDNVRIYRNQALTASEILAIYNQEKPCILPTATLSGTQSIMAGQSADISINLTGTWPWSMVVNGNSYTNITTSPFVLSLNPVATTTYTISNLLNECGNGTTNGAATITVIHQCPETPIPAIVATPSVITLGQSSVLSVANCGGTVTWGANLGTGLSKTVSPLSNTTYTAQCIMGNCISQVGYYTLVVNPNGCNFNTEAYVTTTKCGQSTGAINLYNWGGTSPYSYTWSNGASTYLASNLAVGTYTVRIQDANNCIKDSTFTVNTNSINLADSIAISHTTFDQALVNNKILTWQTTSGSYNLFSGSDIKIREINPASNTSQLVTLQGITNTYANYQIIDIADNATNNSFSMLINLISASSYKVILLNVDYNYNVLNQFTLGQSTVTNVANISCSNMIQSGNSVFLVNAGNLEAYSRQTGAKISTLSLPNLNTNQYSLILGTGNVLYAYGQNVDRNKVYKIPFDNNGIFQTPTTLTTSLYEVKTVFENQSKLYVFGTEFVNNLTLGRIKLYDLTTLQELTTFKTAQNVALIGRVWPVDNTNLLYASSKGIARLNVQANTVTEFDIIGRSSAKSVAIYWSNNSLLIINRLDNYVVKGTFATTPPVAAQITHTTCGISNGAISLTVANATVAWSNGASSASLVNVAPGSYSVTITPSNGGCAFTKSYQVNGSVGLVPPTLTPSSSTITSGQNVTLTASGCSAGQVNWSWSNSSGSGGSVCIYGTCSQYVHNPTVPTSYTAICKSLSCTASATITLTVVAPVVCTSMYTVKTGNWTDPTVWSCNRVPIYGDNLKLSTGHVITIPASVTAYAQTVQYFGQLIFGSGAQLRFGPAVDLITGLIAYYPFNGNANDASGNGNNGIVTGATLTTDRFGNTDRAYAFNGVNNKIEQTVNSLFSIHELTISVWASVGGAGVTNPRLVAVGPDGTSLQYYGLLLEGISTPRRVWFYTSGTITNAYTNTLVANNAGWNQYTVTFKNNTAKIFVNGSLDKITLTTGNLPSFSTALLQIGHSVGDADWFNGKLDDIRIYNRALTDAEVQVLYSSSN